ncbi:ROK family protein [Flavisolibacter ginsenosidimutans]|uniref:ROK family protein n=1 Tax=Flavisolibacter ginsenosidimutans TaxID=661481 RepID=A0A5B8UFW7_9BACT|nr:ROK family protein [Flavisolibacter ginsenosidimutans]QEC55029.1 ROK family protein [Flavisolibacter ginsenosidimutans]
MIDLSNEFAVGIDIGGTNTKYGLVNHRGEIMEKGELRTDAHPQIESFIDALYEALEPIIKRHEADGKVKGIGIGAPNGNFYTGTIDYAPNLLWRGIIPLAKLVTEKFNLPAALTNDANAAAVGEMNYGAARGMRDFIMITLGTGVGSGIVANGQLIYGHDGFAGELGHTIIRPGGRKHWSTDLDGSLEAYCSATGIVLTAKELLEQSKEDSTLRKLNPDDITSKEIYECAVNGDKIAQEVYRFTGQILGEALANFVMFSSPEAIVLFGGVIKAGDLIMEPTREHMEKNLLPIFQDKVKLVFSELKEADAAILGASALVWDIRE